MRYRVKHRTSYVGLEPISVGHNQAWLRPPELPHQHVENYDLIITPEPSLRTGRKDSFGNWVTTFSFNEGYQELHVDSLSEIEVTRVHDSCPDTPTARDVAAEIAAHVTPEDLCALQFLYDSPLVNSFEAAELYAGESVFAERPIADAVLELMARIHAEFAFDPHATTISTPVVQVFEQRRGVCQDFAHVMLAMLRSSGVAARYVSGYIRTYPPPGQERLVGADATHAWISVYCGNTTGWVDFDPTNNLLPGDEHITVAWGRDYSDVPPLRGVFLGGGNPQLAVSVDVEPLS